MKKNRNTNLENFKIILENIRWYLENSRSVTIQTVITPYNIKEKEYFPFEYYGESIKYRFSVPSHIFTPYEFQIS